MKNVTYILIALAMVLASSPAWARGKKVPPAKAEAAAPEGKAQKLAEDKAQKAAEDKAAPAAKPGKEPLLKATITRAERDIIQEYVESHEKGGKPGRKEKSLPPGLSRKAATGNLPPGWEKKIAAGEVMPPEVFKASQPLPRDLSSKLPPQAKGVATVVIEGKVVRVMEATREIVDVLDLRKK